MGLVRPRFWKLPFVAASPSMVSPPRSIAPVTRPVTGSIRPPGSKSLTNRAVVLAAMARGESRLNGVLQSIDTRVMLDLSLIQI